MKYILTLPFLHRGPFATHMYSSKQLNRSMNSAFTSGCDALRERNSSLGASGQLRSQFNYLCGCKRIRQAKITSITWINSTLLFFAYSDLPFKSAILKLWIWKRDSNLAWRTVHVKRTAFASLTTYPWWNSRFRFTLTRHCPCPSASHPL